jgi:hypothetical protein
MEAFAMGVSAVFFHLDALPAMLFPSFLKASTHHLQLAWGGKNWEMKELYYLVGIGFISQLKDLELYSIKVYNNSLMVAAIA